MGSRGIHARDLAWTVAGATAGSFVRISVNHMWPGRAFASLVVLTAIGAGCIGFALVASSRASMKAALIAAGGAAGSVSAVAVQAASAVATQSLLDVAGFLLAAVPGVPLGMLVGFAVMRETSREKQG